jgi:phage tail sheath protein FI
MSIVIENELPGVNVIVNGATVARTPDRQPTSTAFVVGYFPWGPVNVPTLVAGWARLIRMFGGLDPNSHAANALYYLFKLSPGKLAYVCRVVGDGAALATLTLKDKSADAGVNTLRVDAKYPSSRVDIKVTVAAGTNANTFKLTIRSAFFGPSATELWDNLDLSADSLATVNQNSLLVNLTNLNSVTDAPNNIPRVLVETALAGGDDDFAGLAAADFIGVDTAGARTGLHTFDDENLGIGQVAIPGVTTDAAHAALIAHAAAYDRTAFIDVPPASDYNDVVTIRENYDSPDVGILWPWPEVKDFAGSGLDKNIPPSSIGLGECALADTTYGVHRSPANLRALPSVINVERYANGQSQVDDKVHEFLNSKGVCVIRPMPQQGIRLYGDRVPSSDTRIRSIGATRLVKLLKFSGKKGYAWAVFQTIDGQGRLFRDLRSTGEAFLREFWKAGALFGRTEKEAFTVFVDETDTVSLDQGKVPTHWGVKISPRAEQILIFIDNVPLTQDLSVLQS